MIIRQRLFMPVFLIFFIVIYGNINAQITQTIRGKVLDSESNYPLIGVNVVVLDSDPIIGAVTDVDGKYRLSNVPLGRHKVKFSYIGYKDVLLNDVIVTSGKEVILDIKMEETVTKLKEVVIVGKKSGDALNEMAVLSAREFSVYETEKYAGSRGEPARMARNYAGVLASDDSRNDIVIRGNTPTGVLWRLDGINIPNPNHFSIPGTGGGPVTILNNKFLSNSDFFTGAFPAEYANGIAGVFDLRMRNGNNEQYEGSVQFGFLGTELMAEGPINKKKGSSFLAMYRYSTVSIFKKLGIDLGTTSEPVYQDGAFRFNFPLKKGGNIALFGIGGKSNAPIVLSTQLDTTLTELYGSNDRDQYFGSRTGIIGLSYTKAINPKTFVKAVFSASQERVTANHDKIVRHTEGDKYVVDTLINILDYVFRDNKYSAYFSLNKKYSSHLSMKAGLNVDMYDSKYLDSVRVVYLENDNVTIDSITPWRKRWDSKGNPMLIQPYVQFKYKATDRFTITGGLTSLIFTMSKNSISPIEPRVGLSYRLNKRQKINFATGLHSQILAPYLYYYDKNDVTPFKDKLEPYNKDLKLMKSMHVVAGYESYIGENIRFKAETYYQYLFDLPVEVKSSAYSLINSGTGFSRFFPDTLTSNGTGRNYGIDLTIERSFSKGYFFMTSGSIFDSKYRGSDDTLRNTSFNGRFAANLLFGKEFKLGYKQTLNIGFKIAWTGGQRYGVIDKVESQKEQEIVYSDVHFNDYQFKNYFRADMKIAWKLNTKKYTHEIAIDVANLFNTKNVLRYSYAPGRENPILEEYQLGRLPIFYYRFDF